MRSSLILLFIFIAVSGAFSGEAAPAVKPPEAADITQAIERGKAVRDQKVLVPAALMRSAVILKAGPERCGHALVMIDDAKGDGGAVYRLTERLKIAMPQGNDIEVVEYTGSLLLAADLSLMSGKQASTRTVLSGKSSESETVTADIVVSGGELSWSKKEKRGDEPEMLSKPEPVKLHGVRPLPRNALIACAAFASNEPGFMPGVSSPFIVPSMDMGWTIDAFIVQPAWLSFEQPKNKSNPAAKLVMSVRYLDGEIDEKGLKLEPPASETWNEEPMLWTFDGKLQIVNQPAAGETLIQVETVDPLKLNLDEALDFPQIKKQIKQLEELSKKDALDKITKVPLK